MVLLLLAGPLLPGSALPPPGLRVGVPECVDTLNPLLAATPGAIEASRLIYGQLLTLSDGQVAPGLATFEVSEDELIWSFAPVEGRFHDGRAVTAEDIAYTLQYLLDLGHPLVADWSQGAQVELAAGEAVLSLATAPMVAPGLDMPLLPRHIWQQGIPQDPDLHIGAGPFQLHSWARDDYLLLEPADPSSSLGYLALIVMPCERRMREALLEGELDVATGPAASTVPDGRMIRTVVPQPGPADQLIRGAVTAHAVRLDRFRGWVRDAYGSVLFNGSLDSYLALESGPDTVWTQPDDLAEPDAPGRQLAPVYLLALLLVVLAVFTLQRRRGRG